MYLSRQQNSHRRGIGLDVLQVLCAVVIVVLAVVVFLYQESYLWLFPLIFALAAALNLSLGISRLVRSRRQKLERVLSVIHLIFGLMMLALCIISAVAVWR